LYKKTFDSLSQSSNPSQLTSVIVRKSEEAELREKNRKLVIRLLVNRL